jgi:hypothetical protein
MNRLTYWLVVATMSAVGCEEKKPSSEAPAPDASRAPDKYATADPKLAKVLQGPGDASAGGDKGPPPEGIFPPGRADERHAKGVPTKVDFVNDGAEPRVSLLGEGDKAAEGARSRLYGPAALELGMQMGPRTAMPTIDFALSLGPGRAEEGGADYLVADVKKAMPSKRQLGQLPPGTDKDIAALGGTSIRIRLLPDGRTGEFQAQLSKSAHSDLERLATTAAEALVFVTVPLPSRPVGSGAMWIAETRMPLGGLDVIAYRAYRVKDIAGDRVRLALEVKAYAADKDVQLQGVPKGANLEQFDAQAAGELELVRGESLARKSDVQERVVMLFQAPGATQAPPSGSPSPAPGNILSAQLQSQATFVRGEDMRVTARQP